MKVWNFSECLSRQYLGSIKLGMVMHHYEPEYVTEIFVFKIKATFVSTRFSDMLKLLQPKLV